MSLLTGRARPAVLVALVALLVTAVVILTRGPETRTVTAHFSRAVSLYEGSEVRILGVPVGEVTAVVPSGSTVRVEMEYDAEYAVPQDAQAVIVTPTLTADRFVQLSPAYTSGPKLADGAEIAVEDTGTPIELDRIYRSLADLTEALGPNGVNEDGTLDHVLTAGAGLLDGQGRKANRTIVDLSKAMKTLGDGSEELFGTVRALDEFTGALAANDAAVSRFMADLGAVSQQLAGEREALTGALRNLAQVLGKVERFVKDNRRLLTSDLADLARILEVIGGEKVALETILDVAPSAMGNLAIAFDPKSGSIGSRIGVEGNVMDLDGLLCSLVRARDLPVADQACQVFEALLEPVLTAPAAGPAPGTGQGTTPAGFGTDRSARDLAELLGEAS